MKKKSTKCLSITQMRKDHVKSQAKISKQKDEIRRMIQKQATAKIRDARQKRLQEQKLNILTEKVKSLTTKVSKVENITSRLSMSGLR